MTGASSGIGRAIARAFAGSGAEVVGMDRRPSSDGRVLGGDTGRVEDVERVADAAGRIDIWVNNAARLLVKPFVETTDEDWHGLLAANLHGYFYGCRAAARRMCEQGTGGRIINVTSAVNALPAADLGAYTTAKGGILGMTRTLALELAPHGVTVNAIAPGATDTPLNADAYTPEVRRTYEERIPLGRIGVADEIADAAVFLASDAARYVTGHELLVDGGLTINGSVGHARD